MNKEREIQQKKEVKEKIDKLTKQIRPEIDEANEIAKQLGQEVNFSFSLQSQISEAD